VTWAWGAGCGEGVGSRSTHQMPPPAPPPPGPQGPPDYAVGARGRAADWMTGGAGRGAGRAPGGTPGPGPPPTAGLRPGTPTPGRTPPGPPPAYLRQPKHDAKQWRGREAGRIKGKQWRGRGEGEGENMRVMTSRGQTTRVSTHATTHIPTKPPTERRQPNKGLLKPTGEGRGRVLGGGVGGTHTLRAQRGEKKICGWCTHSSTDVARMRASRSPSMRLTSCRALMVCWLRLELWLRKFRAPMSS
jgi:hypothetical protein